MSQAPGSPAAQQPAAAVPGAAQAAPHAEAAGDVRQAAAEAPQADFLHQPFNQAVRSDAPVNALPPTRTITGKSVGKIYAEVERRWGEIRFRNEAGQPYGFTATVETELGRVVMELWPHVAPNHVRSFIALAEAGYYDGLVFETRIGSPVEKESPRAVTAGSPLGDGDDLASVGYWLLPEILLPEVAQKRGVKHQPGTVGAVHAFGQPDTAGCRFYVSLTEAPAWDGEYTIFGRVTEGLEVLERIYRGPVLQEDGGVSPFEKPATIRRVTISRRPLEKTAAESENKK